MCGYDDQGDISLLSEMTWILTTAWETLALCLAIWIAVKHFRELRGPSTGWTVRDCFAVLVKSHVFYFARFARDLNAIIFPLKLPTSFVAVSSLQLSDFSPQLLVCQPTTDICI